MFSKRHIVFCILICIGFILVTVVFLHRSQPSLQSTLAPAYQVLGQPVASVNHAITNILSLEDIDEEKLGDTIKEIYMDKYPEFSTEIKYVNSLIESLAEYGSKKFKYEGLVIDDSSTPNAFALPGGVIVVTQSLLDTVNSESELVSILAHEKGHIELSHCLDAVKFRIAAEKVNIDSLGFLADFIVNIFIRHSFSKSQENEADEYAYQLLVETDYDPGAMALAFSRLLDFTEKSGRHRKQTDELDPLRDYFLTHPPLKLRIEKYSEKAKNWWQDNPTAHRYVGGKNLTNRLSKKNIAYPEEWGAKVILSESIPKK